ncbi:MAG: alpha/beta fold hydrolase, partial [Luteimonas sp.]
LMQERLWMLEQFTPGQLTYNTPSAHRLSGPLDTALFARAFDALVQRQAVLRTSIGERDGEAFQLVHDRVDSGLLPVIDLTKIAADKRDEEANERIRVLIRRPFDLRRAPLFEARLFKLDEDHHILFFMAHHAIWDGWSFDVLYTELAEIYGAFLENRAPVLPALPVSYGDFSAWHREWVQGPEYAEQLAFWRDRLGRDRGTGAQAMRALPTDKPRKAGMSGQGHPHPIVVSRELTDRLHATALGLESTLFVTLLTLYFALIGRVTAQRDIIIATPVRGRNSEETEGLMGYFTNLLPLRVKIDPSLPFTDALRKVKSVLLDSLANPDIRLEDLMRELNVRGADGSAVLYHSLFSFQDIRQRILRWGNVQHERVRISRPGATEDLGMWFVENENGLSGVLTYNVDLLFGETAAMLWRRYHGMLESLARDPSQSIEALTRFDDGLPVLMGRDEHTIEIGAPEHGAMSPTAPLSEATRKSTPMLAASADSAPSSIAPTDDPSVRRMAETWAEVLGRDSVGLDEDFFALGGHSLQAVQMFHRIGRQTGVNLPLATLFAAPTVRTLTEAYRTAAAVREHSADASAQASSAADPWAPLVPMRAGSQPAPLFFIHAVGGNVLNYRPIAAKMPPGMPVYGLQALGLDGRTPPLTRIEDMAERYVYEIRKVQPHGPYYLAGGSMGGMIAYEMAQRLVAAGERVAMLGLIDTSSRFGSRVREASRRPPSQWRKLRNRLHGLSPIEALRAIAAMARMRMQAAKIKQRIATLRARGEEVPHDLRYGDIEAVHHHAYQQYEVKPYGDALTLFRAEQQHPDYATDQSLGWEGLVACLEVLRIPGDHDVIVEAPELARGLCSAIEASRHGPDADAKQAGQEDNVRTTAERAANGTA